MEPALLIAITLMVLGVFGSVAPGIPGALFSILGLIYYWVSTGYTSPGTVFLTGAVIAGVFAMLFDWFGGAISAKAGGASNRTTVAAAIAGFLLLFVAGPFGLIAGIFGVVFIRESLRTGRNGSLKASLYATAGVLASGVIQLAVTFSVLVGFLLAVIL